MNTSRGLFKRMSNKDKIIWLLTLILFCSFTIFETYSWGRYVLLGVSVLIALFCSPPGSSVHGILQAGILEWVAMPFSRASSRPRDQTWVSHIAGRLFAN